MCQQKEPESVNNSSEKQLYKRIARKQQDLSEFILNQYVQSGSTRKLNDSGLSEESLKHLIRIVGGIPAGEGEFKECCLIGNRNPNGTTDWFCTGVLIHPQVVITAAHCITPGRSFVVALNTNSQNMLSLAEIINVRKATIHPAYFQTRNFNDIAVLVLQSTSVTPPVPIGSSEEINTAQEVMLVGFGNDDIKSTKGFGIKRKVEVDIVSLRRNPKDDLNADESRFGYESDLEFVAGGNGFDTCNGDSGGPVYIIKNKKRVVAGLTSRSTLDSINPCGEGGIYTRVDAHRDFIESFTNSL